MDRAAFNAMLAQYATPEVSGDGRVSWDKGVRCVIPEVKLYGKCEQETLTGKNLFDPNAETVIYGSYCGYKQYSSLPRPFTLSISLKPGKTLPANSYLGFIIQTTEGSGTNANWLVLNGEINSLYGCKLVIKETDYYMEMIGVYPPSSLPSFLDALNIQIELGSTATAYEPYCGGIPAPNPSYPMPIRCNNGVFRATDAAGDYDGGQAMAPELYAIPGTEYRDEWNPQTGWGVRRVKKLVLDGTENWKYSKKGDYKICIYAKAYIPALDATYGNAMCSHFSEISYVQATNLTGEIAYKCSIALANTTGYIYMSLPLSLLDTPDLDGAKGYLAKQYTNGTPVTLFATQDPEPFYIDPARLTQPNGPGQILQVSGVVADCPISARYLTHS